MAGNVVNFSKSISVLSYVKKIFGLDVSAEMGVSKKTCFAQFRSRYNIFWIIYAFLLHSYHFCCVGRSISFSINLKVSILDYGIEVMFAMVGVVTMATTILWCFKNTIKMRDLKAAVDRFDSQFSMLGKTIDNERSKRFAMYEMFVVLTFWFFYGSYYVFWNCDSTTKHCLKNFFVLYHPHKILLTAFMEELSIWHALGIRFQSLNQVLSELQTDSLSDIGFKYIPQKIMVKNTSIRKSQSKLIHCRQLHYSLCEICEDLNATNSMQTLANILDSFVNIFVSLYLLCFGYSRDVENAGPGKDPLGLLLPLCVGGEAFIKIFCLAKYGELAQREASRTGAILHKISMYSLNDDLKSEVVHFSLQILHKKVHVTACGMFPIDYSLVYNVVAAVTTFIVILIQFALAINFKEAKPTDNSYGGVTE